MQQDCCNHTHKSTQKSLNVRSHWSPAQREKWAGAYPLFLSALHHPEELTPAQFALRFCLSFEAISSVIPGMLTSEHVKENTYTSTLGRFSTEECRAILNIYQKHKFFVGK